MPNRKKINVLKKSRARKGSHSLLGKVLVFTGSSKKKYDLDRQRQPRDQQEQSHRGITCQRTLGDSRS